MDHIRQVFYCLCVSLVAACGGGGGSSSPPPAAKYTVTDLGTLAGGASFARGINNAGQVVGNSDGRAFLYADGRMRDLDPQFGGNNLAYAINNHGQVVGWSQDTQGDLHAFLYSDGTTTNLFSSGSEAIGINDNGDIVGWVCDTRVAHCGSYHPFLLSGGSTTILGPDTVDSYGQAIAINARGQVAGFIVTNFSSTDFMLHAFLFSDGATTDLGTLDSPSGYKPQSSANAINGSGQVVGYSDSRAFLYSGGAMTDLGTIADYSSRSGDEHGYAAVGINAAGEIVGNFSYTTSIGGAFFITPPPSIFAGAWLYREGVMRDLNSLIDPSDGWTIQNAVAINDAGQIAANGGRPGVSIHALLLSPR